MLTSQSDGIKEGHSVYQVTATVGNGTAHAVPVAVAVSGTVARYAVKRDLIPSYARCDRAYVGRALIDWRTLTTDRATVARTIRPAAPVSLGRVQTGNRHQSSPTVALEHAGRRRLGYLVRHAVQRTSGMALAGRSGQRQALLDLRSRLVRELSERTGLDLTRAGINADGNRRAVAVMTGRTVQYRTGGTATVQTVSGQNDRNERHNSGDLSDLIKAAMGLDDAGDDAGTCPVMPARLDLGTVATMLADTATGRIKTICIQLVSICSLLQKARTFRAMARPARRIGNGAHGDRATGTAIDAGLSRVRFNVAQDTAISAGIRSLDGSLVPFTGRRTADNGRINGRIPGARSHGFMTVNGLGMVASVRNV